MSSASAARAVNGFQRKLSYGEQTAGTRLGEGRSRSRTRQEASFLKELQEKLDIPPDVLASLSPTEMADIKTNINKQSRVSRQQHAGNGRERKHDE